MSLTHCQRVPKGDGHRCGAAKKEGLLASSPLLKPIRQAACQQLSMSGVILHKICRQNISHTNLKSQMQRQKHVSALLALRPFPPASRHGGTHGRRGQAPEGGAGDAGARHDDGHVAEHGRWVRVFHAERGHCLIVIGGSLDFNSWVEVKLVVRIEATQS